MARRQKGHVSVARVNALAELDRLEYRYEPISEAEIKLCCPACKERNPSCSFNVEKNVWKCHAAGCHKQGDIATFLAHATGVTRATIIEDLSTRYELQTAKVINPEVVEKFHKAIWNSGPLLKALRDRGITDDMIRRARLGVHSGRITIPVYDSEARVVNVRRYLPGAPGPEKMRNSPGYGRIHLYNPAGL